MVERKVTYIRKIIEASKETKREREREREKEKGMMKREKQIGKRKIGFWNSGHHSSRCSQVKMYQEKSASGSEWLEETQMEKWGTWDRKQEKIQLGKRFSGVKTAVGAQMWR